MSDDDQGPSVLDSLIAQAGDDVHVAQAAPAPPAEPIVIKDWDVSCPVRKHPLMRMKAATRELAWDAYCKTVRQQESIHEAVIVEVQP